MVAVAEADVVDLFSGPRGWDVGARSLGIDSLGVELDPAACQTSEAAGFRTLRADVAALDPAEFAPCGGLIGSPPCPAFSMAGQGAGRAVIAELLVAIRDALEGKPLYGHRAIVVDRLREFVKVMSRRPKDPERWVQEQATASLLIAEPGRWVAELRPRWVALEQVPPALPAWETLARGLRELGYWTWTGVLTSEMYGVPQTRARAILIASLDGPVDAPPPTHRRYVAPRRREEATESLFDLPEPERIVVRGEDHLLPWVSMATALGWSTAETVRNGHNTMRSSRDPADMIPYERGASDPAPTLKGSGLGAMKHGLASDHVDPPMRWKDDDLVGFGRRDDTPSNRSDGALEVDGVDYRERDFRPASEPALAITEKSRSWKRLRAHSQTNATVRDVDEPAPTIAPANDAAGMTWERDGETGDAPTHMNTGRDWKEGGTREDAQKIPVDQPAPTISAKLGGQARWVGERPAPTVVTGRRSKDGMLVGRQMGEGEGENVGGHGWTADRPATTVTGDQRVAAPGHHDAEESQAKGAVRVTEQEAAVLQGFPADHPFRGTRTARFRQIGDAMPPPFARAVLLEATRPTREARREDAA